MLTGLASFLPPLSGEGAAEGGGWGMGEASDDLPHLTAARSSSPERGGWEVGAPYRSRGFPARVERRAERGLGARNRCMPRAFAVGAGGFSALGPRSASVGSRERLWLRLPPPGPGGAVEHGGPPGSLRTRFSLLRATRPATGENDRPSSNLRRSSRDRAGQESHREGQSEPPQGSKPGR